MIENSRKKYYNNSIVVIGGKGMDRITQSMLESFKQSSGISLGNQTLEFEYFVNDCVVCNEYGLHDFDLEEVTTGGSTQGIDGIAIIVNQKLVHTTEDIDVLIEYNQSISVKFVVIQTKTSASFDNTEISNMMTFTNIFFSDNNEIFATEQMQKFIELKDYIFSKGDKLKKNPELLLYYVTLGTWTDDENLCTTANVGKELLKRTNLFSEIKFIPCGSEEIQNLYRKTK